MSVSVWGTMSRGVPAKSVVYRVMIVLLVLADAGFMFNRWGGRARLRFVAGYERWRCRTFSLPADRVVFESKRGSVKEYRDRDGYEVTEGVGEMQASLVTFKAGDEQWERWRNAANDLVPASIASPMTIPTYPHAIFFNDGPSQRASAAVVMHARQNRNHARVVVVEAECLSSKSKWIELSAYVLDPATAVATTVDRGPSLGVSISSDAPGLPSCRIFAGQPIAGDPAAFCIRYETPDQSGWIEGRLRDDDVAELHWVGKPPPGGS